MTGAETARLAVVESQVAQIQADVSEIKGDVKALLRSDAMLSLLRWAIPGMALVISFFALMAK